ncbi:hypothetical protein BY458DRAFT_492343 [Sporodiniella umbellata]|nr:hypothetical protein BY458DRAFT_492343 [Sporodiniella umbellata]
MAREFEKISSSISNIQSNLYIFLKLIAKCALDQVMSKYGFDRGSSSVRCFGKLLKKNFSNEEAARCDHFELTTRLKNSELLAASGFFESVDSSTTFVFVGSSIQNLLPSLVQRFDTVLSR